MAKAKEYWASLKDMTLAGQKVNKGQIVEPRGSLNDRIIFADNSRWAYRLRIDQTVLCGTDGCSAEFDCEANLSRHRDLAHKPERDAREKARLAGIAAAKRAENEGQTIGGHEIVGSKAGPHGRVDYINPPGT